MFDSVAFSFIQWSFAIDWLFTPIQLFNFELCNDYFIFSLSLSLFFFLLSIVIWWLAVCKLVNAAWIMIKLPKPVFTGSESTAFSKIYRKNGKGVGEASFAYLPLMTSPRTVWRHACYLLIQLNSKCFFPSLRVFKSIEWVLNQWDSIFSFANSLVGFEVANLTSLFHFLTPFKVVSNPWNIPYWRTFRSKELWLDCFFDFV